MWELGNRDIIVLVSVISGLAVSCNIFGVYLAIAITFLLVLCGWFTYIVAEDDRPFTPQASIALDYIEQLLREFNNYLASLCRRLVIDTATILRSIYRLCRTHVYDRIIIIIMSQRRRSTYQLSSDIRPSAKNSSRSSLVEGLSPIPRNNDFRPVASLSNLENNTPYADTRPSRILERASSLDHVTSTPLLLPWKKKDSSNGDVLSVDPPTEDQNAWKHSQSFAQSHTLSRGEDSSYCHEGSPWGTSISPKMRHRAAGVKTVQTVAGPLLASTRYNIDPKIYSDVTSPGLTTRLTKYATEANTKLTHQSQYGTGQFPRVNLNSSPTPLINTKTGKMRMPVTVRIAPPNVTESYSHSKRKQFLSTICQDEGESQPSVVQVLRDISLKRHASREDFAFELAKKQRTEDVFGDGLENLEEMTQKRGRDDSSRSEEDLSTQNKSLRPAKRSKMPSCHDILSSLSSSIAVSSGIKRKAIDVSRSGTPDVGKHFKSLDSSQGDNIISQPLSRSVSEPAKPNKTKIISEIEAKNSVRQSLNEKAYDSVPHKGILKISSPGKEILNADETPRNDEKITKRDCQRKEKFTVKASSPVKLTDKLFMKAEPENIDKIKTLIEEHGSIKPRFTTDNTEEIKKSDIVNMRQTSMKNRLKSMFDAISGKATNTINPQVVIQAEDKSPTNVASLSSSTFTTNVNTSPIATSAIVPIIGKAKTSTTPAKHVTFQFAGKETAPLTNSVESPKVSTLETKIVGTIEIPATKVSENSAVEKKSSDSIFSGPKSTSPPRFSVGSSSASSPASQIPSTIKPSVAKSPINDTPSVPTTATPQFNSQMFNSTTNTSMFAAPARSVSDSPIVKTQLAEPTPSAAASFSFGATAKTETPASQSATPGTCKTSVGQSLSTAGAKSPVTSVPSGIFEFGTASKSTKSGFPDTSIGQNFPPAQLTTEHLKAHATPFPGVPTVRRAQVVTTTSQQPASSAVVTTSAGSGFNFSTVSAAPTILGASSTTSILSSTSTTPSFTFGTNPTAAPASTKPSFSFGPATSSIAATSTAANTPSMSFGVTSSSGTSSIFGEASTTLSTAASQSSLFGTPSATATAAPTTTSSMMTTPSIFGTTTAPAVAQSSIFGVPATTSGGFSSGTIAFGASGPQQSTFPKITSAPTTFEAAKTMETSAFGANSPPSSFAPTPTSSSLFSGVNSGSSVKNAPKLPSFGDNAFNKISGPSFANNAERSSFAVTTGSYAPSIFGSQSTDAFGNASTSTSGPAASMNTFSNVTTPSFGAPNTAAPPAFGSTNNLTASFGAPTTTAATVFGAAVSAPSTFGTSSAPNASFATTTAPPAFPTLSSPGFGNSSTTAGFGTSANQSSAFNASTTSLTGFGSVSSPTAPFGAQAAPENATFGSSTSVNPTFGGNTNSSNNNANAGFTFGASKPDSQQPQQNSVFTFGGGGSLNWANDQAGNRSAPFQFNAAAPQPAGGFNFTGAPTTPAINFFKDGTSGGSFTLPTPAANSFSVPPATGGMFSIGTGSTTPRSRASRRRQR